MDDTIDLDQLCERYRSERERRPAQPPLDTAARVLAWAGDRLDGDGMRMLACQAISAFARDGIPPELRFSPQTVALIERYEPDPEIDGPARLTAGMAEPDRTTLLAAGLVEEERMTVLAAGMTEDERMVFRATGHCLPVFAHNQAARLIGYFGWMPVVIVAIVAGIVVALILGDWWLFLLTALVGMVLGYVAVIGVWRIYLALDEALGGLRLGHPPVVATAIFLLVGPAVALLMAVLVLSFGPVGPALDLSFRLPDFPPFSITLMMLALWAIGHHYFSDERHRH